MKYEELQKENETIITTNIKGKEYAEVNQRIRVFRTLMPNGCIETEMLSNENGMCIFKAKIFNEDDALLATGTAYEKEGSSFINKTSYIENCETSAIGRALGICGIGIDTSIASAEEVKNTINNQNDEKATDQQILTLSILLDDNGKKVEDMLKHYKLNSLEDMTKELASDLIAKMSK